MADRQDLSALFVRIPHDQARALDRLAFESGRSKQALVSDMLASSMQAQNVGGPQPASAGEDRTDRTDRSAYLRQAESSIGYNSFRAFDSDVLTLEGVAELLSVEPELVADLAARGELPGRKIGGAWRFARAAVLAWLAASNEHGNRASLAETGE
jgi:excisionase family DNA binding protein